VRSSISSPNSLQKVGKSAANEKEILLNINFLPIHAQIYVKEVISAVTSYLGAYAIKGVMLFGSLAIGGSTPNSDIDLLIVVSNSIPFRRIKKVHQLLQTIEIKYGYILPSSNLIERILQVVERRTGMFCSHFICREDDWKNERFHKILSVNRAVAWLLAPDQIVLDSLKQGAKLLYGEIDLSIKHDHYSNIQIFKSLAMTLILSYGAIALIPFHKKFSKYLIEAYKWALRASFFYLFQKSTPLSEICEYFITKGLSKNYIHLFRFYRIRTYSGFHVRFLFQVPFEILKLHRLAYQLKTFSKTKKNNIREQLTVK